MPPRRRKNFFRIRPRFRTRNSNARRLFVQRIRIARSAYVLSKDYRELTRRIRDAAADFLPRNNASGFFIAEFIERFSDLVSESIQRSTTPNAMAFMREVETSLDEYMGDSIEYFDVDSD